MSYDDQNKNPAAAENRLGSDDKQSVIRSPERRRLLKSLAQGTAVVLSGAVLEGHATPASAQGLGMMGGMMGRMMGPSGPPIVQSGLFTRQMPIPAQLMGATDAEGTQTYALKVTAGLHSELVSGVATPTWGYNGAFLGPTIRAPQGKALRFDIVNDLNQSTTIHWHGAHIPGNVDGGPHNPIAPGKQAKASFTLNQPAATLWYHPHPEGRTGAQVFAGLAGLLLVDDGQDVQLGLPHTYGVDDLPVVLQDRRLDGNGRLGYMTGMMDTMGMKGDHFLVNGVEQPYVHVPGQWIRLRILNGSNARIYNLAFDNQHPFHVVASDAGLLEHPVEATNLVLASGERAEIMIDLSHLQGKRLVLRSNSGEIIPRLNRMPMAADNYDYGQFDLLELRVGAPSGKPGRLPDQMAVIPTLSAGPMRRTFVMQGMEMGMMRRMMMGRGFASETVSSGPGGMNMGLGGEHLFAINETFMNMAVINERVKLGSTEIWTVVNEGMMGHPFHIHGTSFQILSRNDAPPPAHERGWKDVVLVPSGQRVQLIARFDQPAREEHPFMYHCHILEHEDNGMMGQFTVI